MRRKLGEQDPESPKNSLKNSPQKVGSGTAR